MLFEQWISMYAYNTTEWPHNVIIHGFYRIVNSLNPWSMNVSSWHSHVPTDGCVCVGCTEYTWNRLLNAALVGKGVNRLVKCCFFAPKSLSLQFNTFNSRFIIDPVRNACSTCWINSHDYFSFLLTLNHNDRAEMRNIQLCVAVCNVRLNRIV